MLIINVQKNARKNINVDGTADDGKETANHDVKTLLATRDLLDAYQAYRVLYSALFVYYQNIVKLRFLCYLFPFPCLKSCQTSRSPFPNFNDHLPGVLNFLNHLFKSSKINPFYF